MIDFKTSAQSTTNGSPIMEGRTKISTEELIARYPNGFTIIAFDVLSAKDGPRAVLNWAGDRLHYYNAGSLLTQIVLDWVAKYDGDIKQASADLNASGGVTVKLRTARTQNGRTFTAVDVI